MRDRSFRDNRQSQQPVAPAHDRGYDGAPLHGEGAKGLSPLRAKLLEWLRDWWRAARPDDVPSEYANGQEDAKGQKWPMLSAIVVNKPNKETGRMDPATLKGFVAAARVLGHAVVDEEQFLREQQAEVFKWAAGFDESVLLEQDFA
jgi:hypothetical protein